MFNLITGPFSSLENQFLRDLRAKKAADPLGSILVLCGSGHQIAHLQALLGTVPTDDLSASLGTVPTGYLNVFFLTFGALAERILADADYPEQVITEPAFYQEAIHRILAGENPEPVDLEIRKALGIKDQVIPFGLTAALSATLKDLQDSGVRADHALKAARDGFLGDEAPEAAPTLALHGRLIGLLEKHDLRSSADVLRRAATHASKSSWLKAQKAIFVYGFYDLTGVQLDLLLSLANHPDAQIYFPYEEGNAAYAFGGKLLKDPAFQSKIKDEKRRERSDLPPSALLSPHSSPFVSLWSVSGSRDEVWLVAKEILKLRDDGMAFGDMAVVSRNLTPYLGLIRELFGSHQIPFMATQQETAGGHPLVKKIRSALVVSPRYDGTWQSHIAWAKSQLPPLPADATVEEIQLFESIVESIDSLNVLDILGDSVSHEHFLNVFGKKLDGLERPGPEIRHDGVQVIDVQKARGLSFKTIFVLGMNEKVFPRLIREDPFLSDKARSALAQATGARLSRKLDGYDEERMLFELLRQSAGKHLILTTQRSDEEGKALIPSVYLRELEQERPGLKPQRLPRALADKFEHQSPLTWTPKELSLLINRSHLDPKAFYTALNWDQADFYRLLAAHRAVDTFKSGIGAHDGVIADLALLKPALARPFSPSSLEDLAECPFQYYAGHVLRITPEEELAPEGEITALALGKLFHRTLEFFYTASQATGLPMSETALSDRIKTAMEASFKEVLAELSSVYPVALKSVKEFVFKELLQFLKSDIDELNASGFRPTAFEKTLEGTLPTTGLPYRFQGRPDRLDSREQAGRQETRVVDYKAGKPKPWSGRIETHIIQGKFLQLPIYLALASAESASLRPVRDPDPDAEEKKITAQFWDSASAPLFIENMKELIGIIEKGKFFIEPSLGEWGYCARCHFARVCRKEHMPTRLRAEQDPLRLRITEKLSRTAPKSVEKEIKVGE